MDLTKESESNSHQKPIHDGSPNFSAKSLVSQQRPSEVKRMLGFGVIRIFAGKTGPFGLALGVVLTMAGLLYYLAITPESFGSIHDDSVYVTTAKSLATGHGYRVISLSYEPVQTKYPPLYSFLLSLIWRAYSDFPQNLIPMMLMSASLTLAFMVLTYRYLVRQNYATRLQAVVTVTLSAFNVYTVILATSLLSEMLFGLFSVSVLYVAEKYEKKESSDAILGASLGLVLGLAFLTRSTALALWIAVALYLALQRKWRKILIPCGIAGIFIFGWLFWCYVNKPTVSRPNTPFYTSYAAHTSEVLRHAVDANTHSTKLAAMVSIAGENVVELLMSIPLTLIGANFDWIPDLGAYMRLMVLILCGIFFLFTARGFVRHSQSGFRLLHIYVVVYLASHLPFPYSGYQRYLVPILPFLLVFLTTELANLASLVLTEFRTRKGMMAKISTALVAAVWLVCVSAGIYNYCSGIRWSLASTSLRKKSGPPAGDREAIEWIRGNTASTDVLACERDPLYYLYTDRKATRSFVVMADPLFENYQASASERERNIRQICAADNVNYVILRWTDTAPGQSGSYLDNYRDLISKEPGSLTQVFESSDKLSVIYKVGAVMQTADESAGRKK